MRRLNAHGKPYTPATLARLEERARLIAWDDVVRRMAVQVVTDEWPRGLTKTIPTHKGTIKLLMQPKASD